MVRDMCTGKVVDVERRESFQFQSPLLQAVLGTKVRLPKKFWELLVSALGVKIPPPAAPC